MKVPVVDVPLEQLGNLQAAEGVDLIVDLLDDLGHAKLAQVRVLGDVDVACAGNILQETLRRPRVHGARSVAVW